MGLAEFSNGNFLGEDATYPETVVKPIHSFPFPSRNTSTTYSQIKRQISFGDVAPMDYPDGGVGNRVYLRKIADGIRGGIRHSVMPYLLTMRLDSQQSPQSFEQTLNEGRPRIDDPNVLNDYHSILIPKAIEYSAGILDYFFRGRLDVCMAAGQIAGTYDLTIANRSGQGFQGGAFRLFWDDANGVRTEIASPAFNSGYNGSSLADNGSITATFTPPSANVSAYTLVYQGIIGADGDQSLDPVEFDSSQNKGLAIAAKRFLCQGQEGPGEDITSSAFSDGTWVSDGTITAVPEGAARATRQAGFYRATYQSGYASITIPNYTCFADPLCVACSEYKIYTVCGLGQFGTPGYQAWTPFIDGTTYERQGRCTPDNPPCASDNRPFTVDSVRLQQNTPRTPTTHCHGGGEFGPFVPVLPSCPNDPATFSPGEIKYSIERLTFRHFDESAGISTLRIQNFSALAARLLPCPECEQNSTLPAWNGELPRYDDYTDPCGGYLEWNTEDPLTGDPIGAINGYGVFAYVWAEDDDLPTAQGVGWRVGIWCETSGGPSKRLWYGYKSKGYTPRGTYILDTSTQDNGCAACSICSITIE